MAATGERRYALTKIKAGDYLLPSNDGQAIYRLASYSDVSGVGPPDWRRAVEAWGVWRYRRSDWRCECGDLNRWHESSCYRCGAGRPEAMVLSADLDWDRWTDVDRGFATRREAIEAALRMGDG